jgi:hypothetical protein
MVKYLNIKNNYYIMINAIISIVKKIMPKDVPKPVGRWGIEKCNTQINNKIDLSNEDHCGPCGQYALTKIVKNVKK